MTGTFYGSLASIGIATPQANPTVEPEMQRLMPSNVNVLTTRSVANGDSRQRLLAYFEELDARLDSFGNVPLNAFGFACTASSYLLDDTQEEAATRLLGQRYNVPVITAAQAIEACLRQLNCERLMIGSPYPAWIHDLCMQHWSRRGFSIVQAMTAQPDMGDTNAIYSIDPEAVADRFIHAFRDHDAQVLLITGTGMPTLPMIPQLSAALGIPVISSNLCLAWACLKAAVPTGEAADSLLRICLPPKH